MQKTDSETVTDGDYARMMVDEAVGFTLLHGTITWISGPRMGLSRLATDEESSLYALLLTPQSEWGVG